MANSSNHEALKELIASFNELNSDKVEEVHEEPSPLEFMRFVARNTPLVIRGAASEWEASRKWNASYLTEAMAGQSVIVACTPLGNADSPTYDETLGETVFVKPHEEDQDFCEFLEYVVRQETDKDFPASSEVRYAQTQNDNFRDEYITLFPDAQSDIPFARIALQKKPEAVNLWIGNSKSATACHKDNFENVFVQIKGRKHFTLLPPLCHPCMRERLLKPATYARDGGGLSIHVDQDKEAVPFATWDPDHPETNATELSDLARPLRVTLNPGDMLYLPAMWYHKVTQSCIPGGDGFVAAVNYWYDMEYSGPLYPFSTFLRNIHLQKKDPCEDTL